jgi:hypothetical protein
LIQLLGAGPRERSALLKALRVELRGFYRDLELLRDAGVALKVRGHRYELDLPPRKAVRLVPFPDPGLTLGEVELLARGKSSAHAKLKKCLKALVPAALR